jgi:hypothetical protein
VIGIVAILTIYASYVGYNKPCVSTNNGTCCSFVLSPRALEVDRPSVNALSLKDKSMLAVTILDALAGLGLAVASVFYYMDTRNDAKRSGYLAKVHNSGYLSRY